VVHFYSATTKIYQRLTGTLLLRRSQKGIADILAESARGDNSNSSSKTNDVAEAQTNSIENSK
jgi:hypothetical protein